jgi:hypothetical protein
VGQRPNEDFAARLELQDPTSFQAVLFIIIQAEPTHEHLTTFQARWAAVRQRNCARAAQALPTNAA